MHEMSTHCHLPGVRDICHWWQFKPLHVCCIYTQRREVNESPDQYLGPQGRYVRTFKARLGGQCIVAIRWIVSLSWVEHLLYFNNSRI